MRTINVTFEDEDIKKLIAEKSDRSWRTFILEMLREVTEKRKNTDGDN